MTNYKYDCLAIGNAIVDIIAQCEEDFLKENNITKGAMNLIDEDRAESLYSSMGPAIETSGGSAGNTAAGMASLGAKMAFIGKVADDHLGKVYRHDMTSIGIDFETPVLQGGCATARSMILVSPDGERSMNTYLGACTNLSKTDIDHSLIKQSRIVYFEGYLWDPEEAKDAIREAARIAHENDRLVAMTLSDSFCVDRFRDEFLELLTNGTVDILFANEGEVKSLYQTSDLTTAIDRLREDCPLSAVTLGEKGSMVVSRETSVEINSHPIEQLVDTTGAGDLFAAGFLFGLVRDYSMKNCARLGSMCASEVIQHIGPRPQTSLKELAQQNGFEV